MKRILLSVFLTLGVAPFAHSTQEKIVLDSSILKFVDGIFIDVGQIMFYGKNLIMLLNGAKTLGMAEKLATAYELTLPEPLDKGNKKEGRYGFVWYEGEYYTIKEMVEIEKSSDAQPEKIQEALLLTRDHFDKLSQDYIQDIQVGKEFMVKLIAQWSILRKVPETLLLNWSNLNGTERESLSQTITSFRILDGLLSDLLLFLADLIQNCPKSHKAYRESLKARGSAE